MSKIKILQFPIQEFGGVTNYAVGNWLRMNKALFHSDFGTMRKLPVALQEKITATGAKIHYISCYAEYNKNDFAEQFRRVLSNGKYDVIHLNTSFWRSFTAEEVALDLKIPKIVVHSHSTRIDIADEKTRIEAEKLHEQRKVEFHTGLATDFWACSNLAADWLYGPQIPRDKIVIVKNAVKVEKFLFDRKVREKYRCDLGIDDCFVIGNVARLCHQKNHEFLLQIFAEVYKQRKNARLMLVGSGELEADIRRQADELGISDGILFLGDRSDVNNLIQAMDVFCLPSRFEGLPIVLVEAQCSGLKCLASETITEESCLGGLTEFLPFETEKWVSRIIELAKGYERKNMHDVITEAGYNIEYQIKELERLYME